MLNVVWDKISKPLFFVATIYAGLVLSIPVTIKAQAEGAIVRIDHTANGNLIALGYSDRSVEIRDYTTNQTLAIFPDPTQDTTDRLSDLAFSPDGQYLATTFGGYASVGILQIIDIGTLHAQQITTPTGNLIGDVTWNSTSDHVAAKVLSGAGEALNDVFVWDIPSGTVVTQMSVGVNNTAVGIDWHPDNTRLINIDRSGVIVQRDTETWQIVAPQIDTGQALTDIRWNNDGTQIISVDAERTIYLWDGTTGSLITSFAIPEGRGRYHLDVNDNNEIVTNGIETLAIVSIDSATVDLIPIPMQATRAIWIGNDTIAFSQGTNVDTQPVDNVLKLATSILSIQ